MKNGYEVRGEVTAIIIYRKDGTKFETLIDTSELDNVLAINNKWSVIPMKNSDSVYVNGRVNKKRLLLHRYLMNDPKGMVVDHINHNTLDNRKSNLRVVSQKQNQENRKGAQKNSKSGVRGVYWNIHSQSWHARVKSNGKNISVGYFKNLHDADKAVREARKKLMFSNDGTGA
jgi:hypothetical protein